MKLRNKLNLLEEYFNSDVILEESENIIPINEETEAYAAGVKAGKAFQVAVVLAIVVAIAVSRARARLKKKEAYYSKAKPKREKMVADKRIMTKKYAAEQPEAIKKIAGKLQDKVKSEVKKKKAAYAAKSGKSQSELRGDKTLTNLDKVKDEKLRKIEDAVKEKLKQKQDKEQLDLDRKIEDWDAEWKEVEQKHDPSSLFNKIAGRKGLGGVLAAWDKWKIDEDRKIYDNTLKYELKQLREYVEKDEDIKAIMSNRKEQKAKMEKEWKKQGLSIEERLKKADALGKEIEKEEAELKNEFPDLPDAKAAKSTLDEALSNWGFTYDAISSKKAISTSQKTELQDLAKEAGTAFTAMSDKYYEALTAGKDISKLKQADKEYKDELDKGQKEFLAKVKITATKEEITKIQGDIDSAVKDLNDIKGVEDPDERELLAAELTILQKKESLASAEGNEKERKKLIQSIEDKENELEKFKEPEEKTKKENNSYNIPISKRLMSLNEWNLLKENQQHSPDYSNQNPANTTDIDMKDSHDDLSTEIDTILDKLKELENGIEEELESIKSQELNEVGGALAAAGGKTVDFIKDFMRSRKVKSNQVKANAIKMQKAKADLQKKEVEPEQKEKIKNKIDKFKETIDKIEGQIDQMAEGPMSKRVKSTYRIQGNMEVAKILASGGQDKKEQIAKLQKQLKDEVAATKKLADDNKDAIAKMKKDQAAKKDGEAPKEEPEDKKKDIEDKANKAMDKEKADAKAAGDKAKADAKAKDSKKVDDAPKPPSKEKQKAAADKINKDNKEKIKAAGDAQQDTIKDTEAKMKKQNKDAMKKGQKDIDNMKKGLDKINKDAAKKKDGPKAPPPIPGKDKKKDGPKAPPPIPGKEKKEDKEEEK